MGDPLTALGFSDWPFPAVPNAFVTKFLCDRHWLAMRLEELIASWKLRTSTIVNLVWSDVGAGKTHTLMHLKWLAAQQGFSSCYLFDMPERPKSLVDFHNAFLGAVGLEPLLEAYVNHEKVFDTAPILRQVCRAVFSAEGIETAAENWVQGIASAADMRRLGIPSKLTAEQATADIASLAAALATGAPGRTLIFVDEFQRVGHGGPRASAEIQGGISSLINRMPEGLSLILSFASPPKATLPEWMEQSLISRAGMSHFIPIMALTHSDARIFLRDILNVFAPNRSTQFFPFTENAVDKLISMTGKSRVLPRDLLSLSSHVFERHIHALAEGKLSVIGDREILVQL